MPQALSAHARSLACVAAATVALATGCREADPDAQAAAAAARTLAFPGGERSASAETRSELVQGAYREVVSAEGTLASGPESGAIVLSSARQGLATRAAREVSTDARKLSVLTESIRALLRERRLLSAAAAAEDALDFSETRRRVQSEVAAAEAEIREAEAQLAEISGEIESLEARAAELTAQGRAVRAEAAQLDARASTLSATQAAALADDIYQLSRRSDSLLVEARTLADRAELLFPVRVTVEASLRRARGLLASAEQAQVELAAVEEQAAEDARIFRQDAAEQAKKVETLVGEAISTADALLAATDSATNELAAAARQADRAGRGTGAGGTLRAAVQRREAVVLDDAATALMDLAAVLDRLVNADPPLQARAEYSAATQRFAGEAGRLRDEASRAYGDAAEAHRRIGARGTGREAADAAAEGFDALSRAGAAEQPAEGSAEEADGG